MATVLICRSCGTRATAAMATNEQDLANVGMLERRCGKCGGDTKWGLAQDYRVVERRRDDRRAKSSPFMGADRRRTDRRTGPDRRTRA